MVCSISSGPTVFMSHAAVFEKCGVITTVDVMATTSWQQHRGTEASSCLKSLFNVTVSQERSRQEKPQYKYARE